jgi:hypothetical protein
MVSPARTRITRRLGTAAAVLAPTSAGFGSPASAAP